MANRELTIYGHPCKVIKQPEVLNPRYFAKAVKKKQNGIGGQTCAVMTQHTLRIFDRASGKNYKCPFIDVPRGEGCTGCEHNKRKKYCSILPPFTIECGVFDARRHSAVGDYRDSDILTIVADIDKILAMEEYEQRIPRGLYAFTRLPIEEQKRINKEMGL